MVEYENAFIADTAVSGSRRSIGLCKEIRYQTVETELSCGVGLEQCTEVG